MLGVQARVMHILVVGLDYKSAPVDIREKLTFQPDELGQAMSQLKEKKSILENIIVSTMQPDRAVCSR
jgi:glutamyl-tRNA reductase